MPATTIVLEWSDAETGVGGRTDDCGLRTVVAQAEGLQDTEHAALFADTRIVVPYKKHPAVVITPLFLLTL